MASPEREKEGRVGGLTDLVGRKGGLCVLLTGRLGAVIVVVLGWAPMDVVVVVLGLAPVEMMDWRAGLAGREARMEEMLEDRARVFLAGAGAGDGLAADERPASALGGMGVGLTVEGRPGDTCFTAGFGDATLFSFIADFGNAILFSFKADLVNAILFSFKADLGVVALVGPLTILLALLSIAGDCAATDTAGRYSPISSMASSKASMASTESSIRVTDLAGDLATIFSTKESSLWLSVLSPFCSLSNVSVRVILAGVRDPIVSTNESSWSFAGAFMLRSTDMYISGSICGVWGFDDNCFWATFTAGG